MDEAGTRDPNARGATTALFVAWKSRTDRAGEPTAAMEQLISNIEDRGLSPELWLWPCWAETRSRPLQWPLDFNRLRGDAYSILFRARTAFSTDMTHPTDFYGCDTSHDDFACGCSRFCSGRLSGGPTMQCDIRSIF